MKIIRTSLILILALFGTTYGAEFTTLKGSPEKVQAAYDSAIALDLTFATDPAQVQRMVAQGLVNKLSGNENYMLIGVSHPYVRPAALLLVERLAGQFKNATNQTLVVTSAIRPSSAALWNSSSKSVHPTGIAIDFRIPRTVEAVSWLEENLLTLQSRGVILATREHNPPHFHVVVLCPQYIAYVKQKKGTK